MTETIQERIGKAEFLRANGRIEECMRLCNEILNEKIDQPEAIFMLGRCMLDLGKHGMAHSLYMQFLRLKPNVAAGWNNLGRCYTESQMLDEAERCFKRSLKLEKDDSVAMSNLGLIYLHRCDAGLAIEWSRRAVQSRGDFSAAKQNLGMAQLLLRDWANGWDNYEATVGYSVDRRERVYGNEDRWDGSKWKTIVAYGEQGLGDEISFASCIPDFIKDCREAVIECDERVEGLFKRSFPDAYVYGTRFNEMINWADKHRLEGRIAFGSLPKLYRREEAAFPGKPYLIADPERRIQWRALLDSLGQKKKIGISWQGGMNKTGKQRRSVSLEALLPVLRQDATFISLQYKNAKEEVKTLEDMYGIKVHHWERAAEARNYDETAALVAELDMVISVTTAVIHLSGALGVPCLVLTPKHPRWFYGLEGDDLPWYKSVQLIRQKKAGDWLDPINEAAIRLRDFVRQDGNLNVHRADERDLLVA